MRELSAAVKGLSSELATVDDYIDEFLRTDMDTSLVAEVFDAVRGSRGKMVRPALLLLSARFGPHYAARQQHLCKLGALVELVHMASLIHDDIIDDSPLRRGRPTVQSRFGKDMAVYAGDFMLSRVLQHLMKEDMAMAGLVISHSIEEMCRGELGQMACRWDTQTTIDCYLKNIYQKSVTLFIAAMRLGAMESGCSGRHIALLSGIGEDIGYMFQMRDDVQDYLSHEQAEGKPVHQDFAEGVYTLPVLYAFSCSPGANRLRQIAAQRVVEAQLLAELQTLICAGGGIEFTRAQIENHAAQARRQLAQLPRADAGAGIDRLIK